MVFFFEMRFTFASASYVEIWNFAQSMPQNAAYSHPGAVLFMPKSIYYPPLISDFVCAISHSFSPIWCELHWSAPLPIKQHAFFQQPRSKAIVYFLCFEQSSVNVHTHVHTCTQTHENTRARHPRHITFTTHIFLADLAQNGVSILKWTWEILKSRQKQIICNYSR